MEQSNHIVVRLQTGGYSHSFHQRRRLNAAPCAFGVSPPTPRKPLGVTRSFAASANPTPTPEMYLAVLEATASAPWVALEHTEHDKASPADRMKRAYSRVFQIIMYLGQPQNEEAAAKFLMVSPAYLLHGHSRNLMGHHRTLNRHLWKQVATSQELEPPSSFSQALSSAT
jgi:hypothetical protein